MKNLRIITCFCFLFLLSIGASPAIARLGKEPNATQVLSIMKRVADWQIDDWQTNGFELQKADWTNATCYAGMYALADLMNDKEYLDFLMSIGEDLNWDTGKHKLYADDYCVAQLYSLLFKRFKKDEMINPFKGQADSILERSHDEPLHWKNSIQYREWAWCDALFMGPPAFAYLSTVTKDPKYLNGANKLWWKTTAFLFDPSENLFFRDESYFDKREKNGEKVFWSRGNGWVLGGVVRMVENLPKHDSNREKYIDLFQKMIKRIVSLQQADGSWHASLLDPGSFPIKETSGTGFFCYALAWGINNGLLDPEVYGEPMHRAWQALVSSVQANGKLGYVQPVGAAPDKVGAESTAVYGVGAFLLAGTEVYKYLRR